MYIGIDPGKNGGIATINEKGSAVLEVLPFIGKGKGSQLDSKKINRTIRAAKETGSIIVMEYVHSTFIGSKSSNFAFGLVWGQIIGAMDYAEVQYHLVPSKTWQAVAFEGVPPIKKPGAKVQGLGSFDTKAMALIAAQRLFPNVDLTKPGKSVKAHDGIVDALLMAHYCKLKYK